MTIVSRFCEWLFPGKSARVKSTTKTAPRDGSAISIWDWESTVLSPDGLSSTKWTYATEPPHGNFLYTVHLGDLRLPDIYWGRGYAWSPCSRYFVAERCVHHGRTWNSWLVVVRVSDAAWRPIAHGHAATHFVYPEVLHHSYYGCEDHPELHLIGPGDWRDCNDPLPS